MVDRRQTLGYVKQSICIETAAPRSEHRSTSEGDSGDAGAGEKIGGNYFL